MDQRPLPAAKQEVLYAGEGQEVVSGVFGGHGRSHVSLRDGVRPSKQSPVTKGLLRTKGKRVLAMTRQILFAINHFTPQSS